MCADRLLSLASKMVVAFPLVACAVAPALAEVIFLPGVLYDQDKHFSDSAGWCNWYYDPDNSGYQPGDPINNTYDSTTAPLGWRRETDNSCWMATAANMLRYVGGPDKYQTWAYDQGLFSQGAVRYWNHGGFPGGALSQAGYDTSEVIASNDDGSPSGIWTNPYNIVNKIRDNLAGAMPVGIGVFDEGGMRHAITVVGIDTTAKTMTVMDSDDGKHDVTNTFSYTVAPNNQIQLGYSGGSIIYSCGSFLMLQWFGSGTLGETSTSGPTTYWSNGHNWLDATKFNLTQIRFTNQGVLNADTSATGLKLLLQGDLTTLNVVPNGSLTWEMLQNSGAHINLDGGTLAVHQDFFNSGTLAIGPGSTFGAGNVSMGTNFFGAGQITQTGGTASMGTIVVGQDQYLTSNLAIQGGQFNAGDLIIGQRGIGHYDQIGGTAKSAGLVDFASEAGSLAVGTLDGGNLTTNAMVLGNAGNGYLTHGGGKLKVDGMLVLGEQSGSSGRYTLEGSGQLEADSLIVGSGGSGEFSQDGLGSVSANVVQVAAGSTSTYTMKNGTLTAGSMSIGLAGVGGGLFTQNQGLATVNGDLRLATSSATSSGTYTMTGGTLSAGNIYVGDKGAGSFTQTGGAVNVAGTLNVGNGNTASCTGHYTLNPGVDATVAASRLVIRDSSSFDHHNGSVNLTSDLTVAGNSSAIYRLYYGTLTAPYEYIGQAGELGKFEQTGGTNNISGDLVVLGIFPDETLYTISAGSTLNVGFDINNYGTFNLNGGVVTADRMLLNLGGVLNSAGSPTLKVNRFENCPKDFTLNGSLYFGHAQGVSSGSHAVGAGGSLSVSDQLLIGYNAPATFTQGCGFVTSGSLSIGAYQGSMASYYNL